jgi:hypothetical protein
VDVNGNGRYDEGIDALDDNEVEITAGFVVPEFPSSLALFLLLVLITPIIGLTKTTWTALATSAEARYSHAASSCVYPSAKNG